MKWIVSFFITFLSTTAMAQLQTDTYETPMGTLKITYITHASILFQIDHKNIFVDPFTNQKVDYAQFPKADLLLITHEHYDHLDPQAYGKILTPQTHVITTKTVAEKGLFKSQILNNGESTQWQGIKISAVAAYNIEHKRPDGAFYHPKGIGNGYVLAFGTFRVYIAGDTENIPEMRSLGKIDVAFLPKNLPYTMSDEQFIDAAKMIHPHVLYVYHYFSADKEALRKALPKDIILK
jgi:L-ascorbate metabolism protein UlaG (beta-lactamase superfamily)